MWSTPIYPTLWPVLLFVVVATSVTGAEAELPSDLEAIVRANTESLSRLGGCKAVLEVSEMTQAPSGDTLSYTNEVSVWTDGRRVREDFVAALQPTNQRRSVELNSFEGKKIVRRYGSPDAHRRVLTPDVALAYIPGSSAAARRLGDPRSPFGDRASSLHAYACVLGHTLEEKVRENAAQGYLPSISQDALDGVRCVLLSWEYPEVEMGMKVWVVPSQGHMIKRLQVFHKGAMVTEQQLQIKQYADALFWFESAELRKWKKGAMFGHTTVRVKALDRSTPIDEKLFTIEGMGIPDGTEIQDAAAGIRFRYGAPFELPEEFVQSLIGEEDFPQALPRDKEGAVGHGIVEQPHPTSSQRQNALKIAAGAVVGLVILASALAGVLALRGRRTRQGGAP